MNTNLGKMSVAITSNAVGFIKGLEAAEKKSKGFGKKMAAVGAMAATGIGVLTTALVSTVQHIDAVAKSAKELGLSAESFQKLTLAADLSGMSTEQLSTSMRRFTNTIGEARLGVKTAQDTFKTLGIELTNQDGTLKTTEQLLSEVADKMNQMGDTNVKNALLIDLFSRSGTKMGEMLKGGSRGLKDFYTQAEKAGVFTNEMAAEAEKANDELTIMKQKLDVASKSLLMNFAPAIKWVGEAAATAFNSMSEGLSLVQRGIQSITGGGDYVKTDTELIDTNIRSTTELLKLKSELKAGPTGTRGFFGIGGKSKYERTQEILERISELEKEIDRRERILESRKTKQIATPEFKEIPIGEKGGEETETDEEIRQRVAELKASKEAAEAAAKAEDERLTQLAQGYKDNIYLLAEIKRKKEEINMLERKGKLSEDEAAANRAMLAEEEIKLLKEQDELLKERAETMNKLTEGEQLFEDAAIAASQSLAQGFEDMILQGRQFSDVLEGIARQLLKMIMQRTITAPLSQAISGMIPGMASGGSVSSGQPYIVGEGGTPELFVPTSSGNIFPLGKGSGSQNVQVSIRNEGTPQKIEKATARPDMGKMIIDVITSDIQRGGSLDASLKGTYGLSRRGGTR